jgi:hypothetical protein
VQKGLVLKIKRKRIQHFPKPKSKGKKTTNDFEKMKAEAY